MGHFRYSLLVAAAIAAGSATGAGAQKYSFPSPPVMPVPPAVAIPDYSAWYLRGDIAWSFSGDPELSQSGVSFFNEDMDGTVAFGAGLGYYFLDNIRGDITADYRADADVTGINSLTGARVQTELSSTVVLASLYYDIGGRDHITPYFGGGIGFTYNDTGSDNNIDFAAAATAGVTIGLRDGLLFDAGYRFLYLGEAETAATGAGAALSIDDIYAHELRVGLRYEIN